MPSPPTHFLVIHVGDNFALNGVSLSLSCFLLWSGIPEDGILGERF